MGVTHYIITSLALCCICKLEPIYVQKIFNWMEWDGAFASRGHYHLRLLSIQTRKKNCPPLHNSFVNKFTTPLWGQKVYNITLKIHFLPNIINKFYTNSHFLLVLYMLLNLSPESSSHNYCKIIIYRSTTITYITNK